MYWGYYSEEIGQCSSCKSYCENDATCEAVECGESYCTWWKNGGCNEYSKLTTANTENLRTCIKDPVDIGTGTIEEGETSKESYVLFLVSLVKSPISGIYSTTVHYH